MRNHTADFHETDAGSAAGERLAGGGWQIASLRKYWRVVVRWKWLIAGIIAGALLLGVIVTMLMTPLYTSIATVEISRQQNNVVNVKGVEPEVSIVDAEFYQTQYALLGARSLAERVVDKLKLGDNNQFFELFGVDPDGGSLFETVDARRLTSAQRTTRSRVATDILLDHITISPVRGSSLVKVSFTSADPQLSQRVVNTWTASYIATNLDRRFEASSYARTYLENRLGQLRQRLEESERQVVRYAAEQRIVTIPSASTNSGEAAAPERTLVADDLSRLNAELATAVSDRIRAESRLSAPGSTSTEALTNGAITALREKRAEVSAQYSNMLTKFEPDYPPARALASQILELDRSIVREENRVRSGVRSVYQSATGREQALRQKVTSLTADALDQRRRSIQYNIFQREADTNRQLYDALLQRYKEIGIAGGIGTNNVLVVDDGKLPEKPSSPKLVINLLIAFALGALIATGTVFVLEQTDEKIKDPAEVDRVIGVPQLGTTPAISGDDPRLVLADRKSALNEAYLSVQTNLRFSTSQGVPKSFGVTSTRPGEGKSTSAFALAQTLARVGKSVVLIDTDMRSPSIHDILGVANDRGVSNFLSGDENMQSLIIGDTGLGFDAMNAGPTPPNAAELLNGTRLTTLIERLLQTYDHVVVDCPPVLGLADAPLIGNHVDGIVYAIEANGARASVIRAAIDRLRSANVTIFGIILTKFEAKRAHYGYGYEYGYGYGQKD